MPSEPTDLQALEQFVVDNDKLLDLEARIGRFNIFDALRIVDHEIRHSNFLAWLLDPDESHAMGGLFLNAVLMDLLRKTPAKDRLFSPIKLDGGELRGVEVRREWKNIDLLITCKDPSFVIAIENKVRSKEHSDQLARYRQIVDSDVELSRLEKKQFVYLTREGDEPSEEDWAVYSYADMYEVLERVVRVNGEQIGDDVAAFLNHYLRLLRSRFMDDLEIIELCKEIYKKHRQAIDLIVEHSYQQVAGYESILELLESSDDFEVFHRTHRVIYFVPKVWLEAGLVPRRSGRPHPRAAHWIELSVHWTKKLVYLEVLAGPADDLDKRKRLIDEVSLSRSETGLASGTRQITDRWTRLKSKTLVKFDASNGVDEVKLAEIFKAVLEKWLPGLMYTTSLMKQVVSDEKKPTP